MADLQDVALCSLLDTARHLKNAYYLHHQADY
jgi:hypothetical protein